jgi:hypothetical protein
MYSTRLLRPCLWTATMVLYWRGAAEHGRPHTFFCTPPRPRTRHKRCAHTKRMSPALQTLQLTPAHCVSSPLHILFHCRHAGTQARRHAGTQARRHAGTQSRSHAATHVKTARGRTHARANAWTHVRRHHVRTSHGAVRTNSNMNIPARQEQNCGAANANRHRKLGCATADALRRGPGAFKAAQPNSPRYTQRGERYSESRLLQFETDGINGAVLAWCC